MDEFDGYYATDADLEPMERVTLSFSGDEGVEVLKTLGETTTLAFALSEFTPDEWL